MNTNELNSLTSQTEEARKRPENKNITAHITTYLRWIGSILIILSAVNFMLQADADLVPAYRYWIGLGLTLLLCGGGLICAYLFNETKGARIFFGLGAFFLPVQVSQVSAMIYAHWNGNDALQPQYSWLQFADVSPAIIAFDFAITGFLLVTVSYACYAILARKHFKTLLSASIIGNILLILPVRDTSLIAFIVAGLFFFLRYTERTLHKDSSMRLPEGIAARLLMSLPLWIILGRSLLHPVSYLFVIVTSVIIAEFCIHDIKRYSRSASILYVCQWIGTLSAIAVWLVLLNQFATVSGQHLNFLLPIAIILFALSGQVEFHARLYRIISSVLAILLTFGAMLGQQPLAPVFSIIAGIFLTVAGLRYQEKTPFISGNICVLGGLLFYWEYAVNLYAASPWISTIAIGLIVLLLASYIENREKQIREKSSYFLDILKSWN